MVVLSMLHGLFTWSSLLQQQSHDGHRVPPAYMSSRISVVTHAKQRFRWQVVAVTRHAGCSAHESA